MKNVFNCSRCKSDNQVLEVGAQTKNKYTFLCVDCRQNPKYFPRLVCTHCTKEIPPAEEVMFSLSGIAPVPYHNACLQVQLRTFNNNNKVEDPKQDIYDRLSIAMNKFNPQFLEMARSFLKIQPLYYDEAGIWWAWHFETTSWRLVDNVDILNLVSRHNKLTEQADFPVRRKDHILTALKMASRDKKPLDMPKHWIQFKDVVVDARTGDRHKASPGLFCVNPIPWKLGKSTHTPHIDALFNSWVSKSDVVKLNEWPAFSLLPDYVIHRVLCLIGTGRNGKSKYQKFLRKFVGEDNVCSASLSDLEENRFAMFDLFRKLVCQMGETNYSRMESSDKFKRLSGQDVVKFEMKGKGSIHAVNYAKMVISTNGLPTSIDESDGFYSRWLTVDFPNTFDEGPCPIDAIPEEEFENFALRCVELLPDLLKRNTFTGEGSIEERKQKYQRASNPLPEFLEKFYVKDVDGRVRYGHLKDEYKRWLISQKRRTVNRNEFRDAISLSDWDLSVEKQAPSRGENPTLCIIGLREKVFTEKFSEPIKSQDQFLSEENLLLDIKNMGMPEISELNTLYPGEPVGELVSKLKDRGDIFEVRPGRYRISEQGG